MDINDYDTWEKGSKTDSVIVSGYFMAWRQFPDQRTERELEQNPAVSLCAGNRDECSGKWKQPELTEQNTREKRTAQDRKSVV